MSALKYLCHEAQCALPTSKCRNPVLLRMILLQSTSPSHAHHSTFWWESYSNTDIIGRFFWFNSPSLCNHILFCVIFIMNMAFFSSCCVLPFIIAFQQRGFHFTEDYLTLFWTVYRLFPFYSAYNTHFYYNEHNLLRDNVKKIRSVFLLYCKQMKTILETQIFIQILSYFLFKYCQL